jgi:hypothetical protein
MTIFSKKIFTNTLSMLLLLLIPTVVFYTMDMAFWLESQLNNKQSYADSREVEDVVPYYYGKNSPISLGEIENPKDAYFRIKFRFRAEDTDGYPNLFQTAPFNQGARVEISGTTAALIISDKTQSNGVRGITLTKSLVIGQWYSLDVEVLNGAFIRASLDGISVANHVASDLSIDTSQLLLGSGFNVSRVFRGDIDSISIMKGNLRLPYQGLRIIYVGLILLIALFVFSMWKVLSEYKEVQKVFIKLTLLVLPLILILLYSEYRLSFLNTVYYTKRIALEQQIDKIETLVLGSSNTVYGISPEEFSRPAFNLAFLGNGMYFDAKLLERYIDRMPKLQVVVLTVNFFTMGLDYETFSQSWRQYFLRQHFNIEINHTKSNFYELGFWLNPSNFSKIALYGEQTKAYIKNKHRAPVDIITTPSGWFDGGDVPGNEETRRVGIEAAAVHSLTSNVVNYEKNLRYWDDIMKLMNRKNIKSVITLLPTDASYYENLDKDKVRLMNHNLMNFARRHNVRFIDYTGDQRFSLKDFTLPLPDHMNARGANKFSQILDDEVINLLQ